jgi:hypothetical protein
MLHQVPDVSASLRTRLGAVNTIACEVPDYPSSEGPWHRQRAQHSILQLLAGPNRSPRLGINLSDSVQPGNHYTRSNRLYELKLQSSGGQWLTVQ